MADSAKPEPVVRTLEEAYFHVSDGGITLSMLETEYEGGLKSYSFKHSLSSFGVKVESSFPLGSTDIVSWMTMALNRISMRVAGANSERTFKPFSTPVSIKVQNGIAKEAALALRVAARYERASEHMGMEFDSPEALQEYLHDHPGADKSLHKVKKPEGGGDHGDKPKDEGGDHGGGEHGEHEEKPKKTFKERLQSLSEKAKSFVSNAPSEIKKFVQDDAHRRGVLQNMHSKLVNLPDKVYENAKHAIKHEAAEFKMAGQGIKAVLKGGKMTDEQKKAVKVVAFDVALTVATAAVTGGLGAGIKGVAAKSVESFGKALAKKLALNTVTHGLGHLTTIEELGHFGHGLHHTLEHFLTAADEGGKSKPKADDGDMIVAYITKLVADEMKNLDPDVLAGALEEAAKDE